MKNNKIYAINYNTYSDIEEVGLFITKKDAEIELNRINKTREHNLKSKKFFGLQEDDGMLALSLEEGYYSIEEKLFGLNKNFSFLTKIDDTDFITKRILGVISNILYQSSISTHKFFNKLCNDMKKNEPEKYKNVKKFKNKSERADRINDILKRFDLGGRKSFYPAQLSGGQKQRVAIAQQILCSNNFLLMDEPFSGLDPNMVKQVSSLIVEVANMHELNTIIIVSHDIPSTAAISDTLWVMGRDRNEKGEIIPGAKIKYEYDLIERNLAWHTDIKKMPEFQNLCNELDSLFINL